MRRVGALFLALMLLIPVEAANYTVTVNVRPFGVTGDQLIKRIEDFNGKPVWVYSRATINQKELGCLEVGGLTGKCEKWNVEGTKEAATRFAGYCAVGTAFGMFIQGLFLPLSWLDYLSFLQCAMPLIEAYTGVISGIFGKEGAPVGREAVGVAGYPATFANIHLLGGEDALQASIGGTTLQGAISPYAYLKFGAMLGKGYKMRKHGPEAVEKAGERIGELKNNVDQTFNTALDTLRNTLAGKKTTVDGVVEKLIGQKNILKNDLELAAARSSWVNVYNTIKGWADPKNIEETRKRVRLRVKDRAGELMRKVAGEREVIQKYRALVKPITEEEAEVIAKSVIGDLSDKGIEEALKDALGPRYYLLPEDVLTDLKGRIFSLGSTYGTVLPEYIKDPIAKAAWVYRSPVAKEYADLRALEDVLSDYGWKLLSLEAKYKASQESGDQVRIAKQITDLKEELRKKLRMLIDAGVDEDLAIRLRTTWEESIYDLLEKGHVRWEGGIVKYYNGIAWTEVKDPELFIKSRFRNLELDGKELRTIILSSEEEFKSMWNGVGKLDPFRPDDTVLAMLASRELGAGDVTSFDELIDTVISKEAEGLPEEVKSALKGHMLGQATEEDILRATLRAAKENPEVLGELTQEEKAFLRALPEDQLEAFVKGERIDLRSLRNEYLKGLIENSDLSDEVKEALRGADDPLEFSLTQAVEEVRGKLRKSPELRNLVDKLDNDTLRSIALKGDKEADRLATKIVAKIAKEDPDILRLNDAQKTLLRYIDDETDIRLALQDDLSADILKEYLVKESLKEDEIIRRLGLSEGMIRGLADEDEGIMRIAAGKLTRLAMENPDRFGDMLGLGDETKNFLKDMKKTLGKEDWEALSKRLVYAKVIEDNIDDVFISRALPDIDLEVSRLIQRKNKISIRDLEKIVEKAGFSKDEARRIAGTLAYKLLEERVVDSSGKVLRRPDLRRIIASSVLGEEGERVNPFRIAETVGISEEEARAVEKALREAGNLEGAAEILAVEALAKELAGTGPLSGWRYRTLKFFLSRSSKARKLFTSGKGMFALGALLNALPDFLGLTAGILGMNVGELKEKYYKEVKDNVGIIQHSREKANTLVVNPGVVQIVEAGDKISVMNYTGGVANVRGSVEVLTRIQEEQGRIE